MGGLDAGARTPVLEQPPTLERYARGSWGADAMVKLIAPHRWHLPHGHG